jgi:hypothetical protein
VISARRRIEMADSQLPGSLQPYHAAEGRDLDEAAALLRRLRESARRMAEQGLRQVVRDVRELGLEIAGCAILQSSARVGSDLATTLSSHALIHTADGNHFREALRRASERLDLRVTEIRERELLGRAAELLALSPAQIPKKLTELGRSVGPPWTQDQKYAAMAALVVLASRRGGGAKHE